MCLNSNKKMRTIIVRTMFCLCKSVYQVIWLGLCKGEGELSGDPIVSVNYGNFVVFMYLFVYYLTPGGRGRGSGWVGRGSATNGLAPTR
jgi:hypothetical protein